ncbi:hypothetical protein HYPSUDRAFT_75557 [Hypholoma sublateritium FD-334 SS-4]|uniref:Selenoprotein O n=1 Tax=Hypholoma sublateritium (strain FD-334 SS-4) TaxID=945553 RepID=A0A0D2P643_HYPSF|nr:hypothetical protein HYPSUDRAFT_75557 [Hypholoma sublateritium FD-334 SS-4]
MYALLRPTMAKYSISALPLAPASALLIHALVPDPHTPSPAAFRRLQAETPSAQRRARILAASAHFSHVAPFPVSFPYAIEPPFPASDSPNYIEEWLAAREAVHPVPPDAAHPDAPLRKYTSKHRDTPLELIGLAEAGLHDCVPHLDVGDAFALLGTPGLVPESDDTGGPQPSDIARVAAAREDLIDVLSGQSVLMSPDGGDSTTAFAPWALRYSGHQFGSFAGQLGDGRAISIHVTPHPSDPERTYELQLKGSGRTPFSRTADGLAVLRSSIREYLCSEAMAALHIPTTRSLALVSLPELAVQRETTETACVLTRMAPSFLRIGNFEAFNGPTDMFFFGGGQQKPDWEGLRILGEWVAHKVLGFAPGSTWGAELVLEVARRNATMVAGWQAYGFMHGVMNTDNISVLGLTIDFGPYAFMDVFDPHHICNHTDEGGRYAYKFQPNMIVYAVRALLNALAPLIGSEAELSGAVAKGWAADATPEQIKTWAQAAQDRLRDEVDRVVQSTAATEYARLMHKRLGLRRTDATDETQLVRPLLALLEEHALDFHGTFRLLARFAPGAGADAEEALIVRLLALCGAPERLDRTAAGAAWHAWLATYAQRIASEREEWADAGTADADVDAARGAAMRAANPRFVLRQWLLEEVIAHVERDAASGKRVLAKVMHMASNPYEPWGAEDDDDTPEAELSAEERAERRFCSLGERKMLGFQCSCSS